MTATVLPEATQLAQRLAAHEAAVRHARRKSLLGAAIVALLVLAAGWMAETDIGLFLQNIHKFPAYIGKIFLLDSGEQAGRFVLFDIGSWYWGIVKWTRLLADTLLIAYVATLLGAVGGFFLAFLAAGNLGVSPWLRFSVRRLLEFCRTVPDLVFGLIFVLAFGLGPMAGILAIAVHTVGALGKLFYEVLENIDQKPVEGLVASGGSWTKTMRFAVLPQVIPNFLSYALLRFEINVRGASVMGFVGAGGIGQDLIEAIRKFYYPDVSAILVLIILTVTGIDLLTERARHRFIQQAH
ncbi:MAG: phosphonate ABC transporter, permease protein PhnE [Rhizobiales bacterium]|nr:phosphonate ABC transporter, permease protein PhnE [Hyphomicrobiales bacterium]